MWSRWFDGARVAYLRQISAMATLDAPGIYWECDVTFEPLKDKVIARVHASLSDAVIELLATGSKWYDTQTEQGSGGIIDLAMCLLRLDFVPAVRRLQAIPVQPSAIT